MDEQTAGREKKRGGWGEREGKTMKWEEERNKWSDEEDAVEMRSSR